MIGEGRGRGDTTARAARECRATPHFAWIKLNITAARPAKRSNFIAQSAFNASARARRRAGGRSGSGRPSRAMLNCDGAAFKMGGRTEEPGRPSHAHSTGDDRRALGDPLKGQQP
jgi:hypothetical protein